MSMLSITVREDRVLCAFCKNWYDPTNQYIKPKYPQLNQWYFDSRAKCKCLAKGQIRQANSGSGCHDFQCKVPLR